MTKKDEELNLAEGLQKGLEQAIAYKKGDNTKAKTTKRELDFEKELKASVEQLNAYAEGDASGVEEKKDKKEK